MGKIIIGALEICDLPGLGIKDLTVRVDTGAKTSSLHVDNIATKTIKHRPWVIFNLHPDIHNVVRFIECRAPVFDVRWIKSSNGERQQRYVIKTPVRLGQDEWPIEITLGDRSDMAYPMLFGREGMAGRVLVDPSMTFMTSMESDS